MPQLSRVSTFNNDVRIKKVSSALINISPAIVAGNTFVNFQAIGGVLTVNSNGAYNLTPTNTFSANVMVWGAGGGSSTGNGGSGGFSTGLMTFYANVSYNVVVGRAGASGTGGGGSGIEYLANANVIIVAGGGGGAGSGLGGAGGGVFAQNGAGANGGTAYSATSPGGLRFGGPAASVFGFGGGGGGTGGGGGGLYGGGASASGGGGGGAYLEDRILFVANTQTGSNETPPFSTYSGRGTGGNGGVAGVPSAIPAGDGLIVITIL
jgi:hypothetical protein